MSPNKQKINSIKQQITDTFNSVTYLYGLLDDSESDFDNSELDLAYIFLTRSKESADLL